MTRMNPLRRLAATVAIVGVTSFGAVALAGPALADESAPADSTSVSVEAPAAAPAPAPAPAPARPLEVDLPKLTPNVSLATLVLTIRTAPTLPIQSPLPTGSVTFTLNKQSIALPASLAQFVQTVAANLYSQAGYQVVFDSHGVLVVGDKICDPKKSDKDNKDCKPAKPAARF